MPARPRSTRPSRRSTPTRPRGAASLRASWISICPPTFRCSAASRSRATSRSHAAAGASSWSWRRRFPPRAAHPGARCAPRVLSVRIECHRSRRRSGLSGLVPTLIAATHGAPARRRAASFAEQGGADRSITFAAGKPVKAHRDVGARPRQRPGRDEVVVGVACAGPERTALRSPRTNSAAPRSSTPRPRWRPRSSRTRTSPANAKVGDTEGVVLPALLAVGGALSSLFTDDSRFVLHGAEIESSGHGAPIGGCGRPDAGLLGRGASSPRSTSACCPCQMNPDQPMRIRVRKARMSLDPTRAAST